MPEDVALKLVDATPENTKPVGMFIGTDVPNAGLSIPFYKGSVKEGHNIPFEYEGRAVIRTAQIRPRPGSVIWLERHTKMTQLFLGLGTTPFVMVLAPPNAKEVPDLEQAVAYRIPGGHGIMIHKGTWHDFPMAIREPVTVLTANSEEVVKALASMKEPREMDQGDVYKVDLKKRLGRTVVVEGLG